MERKEIPILLITGFLGSGKTTLLNYLLNNQDGKRFAVIVNDLGEVNLDAEILQRSQVLTDSDAAQADIVSLQNGCICCSLSANLRDQINQILLADKVDYIAIEASGVSEPSAIAEIIYSMGFHGVEVNGHEVVPRIDAIVTVVDALRLNREFGEGHKLERNQEDEADITNLIVQQIEFCNIVILNKISELDESQREYAEEVVRALQPEAEIIPADHCRVDITKLLSTGEFNIEQVSQSSTWSKGMNTPVFALPSSGSVNLNLVGTRLIKPTHPGSEDRFGISSFLYFRRRPFDFFLFDQLLQQNWDRNVIRAKGLLYFSHFRDMAVMFDQVGEQKEFREAGKWFAAAPEEEIEAIKQSDPIIASEWDPEYGDRMIKLVFIGKDIDWAALESNLDACLAL